MDSFLGEVDLVGRVPLGQSVEEKGTAEGEMAWGELGPRASSGFSWQQPCFPGWVRNRLGGPFWCLGPNDCQAWIFGILGVPPTPLPLLVPPSRISLPAVHLREQGCDLWARS